MMKKILFISALFVVSSLALQAQSYDKSKAVLDKAAAILKNNPASKIYFTLTIEDAKTNQKDVVKGDVVMQGIKFKINTPIMQTYFDGKNQYVYMPTNNEVSITIPTQDELQEVNPALLVSNYAQNSTVQFSIDDKASLPYYTIDIFPDFKAKKAYYKSIVKINKQTSALISVQLLSQNGVSSLFEVTKSEKRVKYNDNFFVFDRKANPKVIINDLR